MKTLSLLFVCFLLCAICGVSWGQLTSGGPEKEFAQKSLSAYVQDIVNEQNLAKFGFKTMKEAQSAQVGDPIPVMLIGLKDLKKAEARTLKSLLIDSKVIWFPVLVNGEVRASIEIVQIENEWHAGEFGNIKSARVLADVRTELPKLLDAQGIKAPYKLVLLKVPVLTANFLLVDTREGQYLIPAAAQPHRLSLENGKVYNADDVLVKLKEAAKEIKEDKVM
jgi:hypothetical protein